MKLREITPMEYNMCAAMACPAVYETESNDQLVIVGRKVDNLQELGIANKVGNHEHAVIVDKRMLRQLFDQLSKQ